MRRRHRAGGLSSCGRGVSSSCGRGWIFGEGCVVASCPAVHLPRLLRFLRASNFAHSIMYWCSNVNRKSSPPLDQPLS